MAASMARAREFYCALWMNKNRNVLAAVGVGCGGGGVGFMECA